MKTTTAAKYGGKTMSHLDKEFARRSASRHLLRHDPMRGDRAQPPTEHEREAFLQAEACYLKLADTLTTQELNTLSNLFMRLAALYGREGTP